MSDVEVQQILNEVMAKIRTRQIRFPSPPAVVARLNKVLSSPNSSITDVVSIVQSHTLLAAKLLQVANSAALSRGREVLTLHEAIHRLGCSFVRNLALSLSLREKFNPVNSLVAQVVTSLWEHSVEVGGLCFLVADFLRERHLVKVDPGIALVVGVTHTIGEIPLVDYAVDHGYKPHLVMLLPEETKQELSSAVLSAWGVPSAIFEAMRHKGLYGSILRYAHEFCPFRDEGPSTEGMEPIDYEEFKAYVVANQSATQDLKVKLA